MSFAFPAAATLLTMMVLGWLLRPLLRGFRGNTQASRQALNAAIYRDQLAELESDRAAGNLAAADYEQARSELQQRLLKDAEVADVLPEVAQPAKRSALALSLLLPLGAALMYLWLGNPAALQPPPPEHRFTTGEIDAMVAKLAARLESTPDDVQGWAMLARSYKALRRFDDAEKAFAHTASILDSDPNLLTEYADLLAVRAAGNLEGKPLELVKRALQLDPTNAMALSLAGTAAYNRQDFAEATRQWETLLKELPPESEDAKALSVTLAEIREKSGVKISKAGDTASKSLAKADKVDKANPSKAVSGNVALAPALAGKVQPDDILFIYARAVEGSRMPLAILRKHAADLPLAFTLDDALAINPAMNISGVAQVKIEARVSKSGQAIPQTGDLIGESGPVKVGARDVRILIERAVP